MILPQTHVFFTCADEKLQRLFDTAEQKADGNLRFFGDRLVLVEGGGYEKIWLETQPMGGEMYAKRNMEAAVNNSLLFMETQRADGRPAGSIQCMPDGSIQPQFNKFQGFCFPHHALNLYYLTGRDERYLLKLRDFLERFDAYLWKHRDTDGDGCLESFCVYDTGEDHAVRYGRAPVYCETDEPPADADVVPMASMDVTSFSYAAQDTLAHISGILRDGREEEHRAKAARVARSLKARLWDEARNACFDRDKHGKTIDVLCHNNLRCMYWRSFSQEMADRFVQSHLLNPREFLTPLPLPSVAACDPAFRNASENNWSGQCEGLTYQRAILALENYGYEKLVTALGKKLLCAIINGGYAFTQQYDPFTAAPSRMGMVSHRALEKDSTEPCQDAYGPTLLAALEYIAHMYGVHMQLGEVWFSLCGGMAYTYTQQFGAHEFTVASDGVTARVLIDRTLRYTQACGVRLVTDESGRLLRTIAIE